MTGKARKTIAIYKDQLARTATDSIRPRLQESFGHTPVVEMDTTSFIAALQNNTCGIAVLPGIAGETSHYYDLFGGNQGYHMLKNYVESGGVLLSICAGSYFISRETQYVPHWSEHKSRTNIAPLFDAVARGPIENLAIIPDGEEWFSDCSVTNIDFRGISGGWIRTGVAYGNGPALFPTDDEKLKIDVLARYSDAPDSPIAAAWKTMGKGAVLWLGVLPHIGYVRIPDHFRSGATRNIDHLRRLNKDLEPHERRRSEFWNIIVKHMKDHIRHNNNLRLNVVSRDPDAGANKPLRFRR